MTFILENYLERVGLKESPPFLLGIERWGWVVELLQGVLAHIYPNNFSHVRLANDIQKNFKCFGFWSRARIFEC